jgi:hypothetical protein
LSVKIVLMHLVWSHVTDHDYRHCLVQFRPDFFYVEYELTRMVFADAAVKISLCLRNYLIGTSTPFDDRAYLVGSSPAMAQRWIGMLDR